MSDGRLYLDAKVALDGARNLTAAGQDYLNALTTDGRQIAAKSQQRPWGKDDIGQSFENNYRPIEQQVFQAWGQLAEYIQVLGDAAATSVTDNQGADNESAMRVSRSYQDRT